MKGIRRKDDPWNSIIGGGLTGAALSVRAGFKEMRNGAISYAIMIALIEGVGIWFTRRLANNTKLEAPPPYQPPEEP